MINNNDSGAGSLRQAIINANATTAPDVVDATGVSGTINLGTALPILAEDVEIRGPATGALTLRRGMGVMSSFGIFTVNPGVTAGISGLTVASGNVAGMSTGGAGINNAGTLTLRDGVVTGNVNTAGGGQGGGILNSGRLSVLRSTVSGNSAPKGGGIANVNAGDLTVQNSTVSGNTATDSDGTDGGAGINNRGATATVANSTVTGNTTEARGGGLSNVVQAAPEISTMTVKNSTVASNSGDGGGDNLFNSSNGGTATFRFRSTLVSDPKGAEHDNCGSAGASSFDMSSQGYNLASDASCSLTATADQPSTNPNLGPLANNGGPTRTMALPLSSPAVDKGIAGGLTTDQRGLIRPVDFPAIPNASSGDGTDIGAFEVQAPPPEPPSNEFSFGKVKKNKKKGTAKLTVIVPGPGALDLAKTKKLKPDEKVAAAAGEAKLKVKSKGKSKRKLRHRGKAKVTAEVTYTPTGGESNTLSKKLKLKKRR